MSWLPRLTGRRTVVTIHAMDHERAKWGQLARTALQMGLWTALRVPDRRIVGQHLQKHILETTGVDTIAPQTPQPKWRMHRCLKPGRWSKPILLLYLGRLVPEEPESLPCVLAIWYSNATRCGWRQCQYARVCRPSQQMAPVGVRLGLIWPADRLCITTLGLLCFPAASKAFPFCAGSHVRWMPRSPATFRLTVRFCLSRIVVD